MSIVRNLFQLFFVITILGALNWGLVAINSQNDLFLTIFPNSVIARSIFYFIIGISRKPETYKGGAAKLTGR